MEYKILIIKNNVKNVKLDTYLKWFKKNTPIEITYDTIETKINDLKSASVSNGVYSGVIINGELVNKLKPLVLENKYNAVVFAYDNDLQGIRMNVCNGENRKYNLYPNTELIQLVKFNDNGKTLNHELFHAFFAKLNRLNINVIDNMDTYNNDFDTTIDNVINTNREYALKQLNPYWDKVCSFINNDKPIIHIKREIFNNKETLGTLTATYNGNTFSCKTLELPWLNNQSNISCIPTGQYVCKWTYSLKFPLGTYQIMEVPNRSGIRLHIANYYSQIQGCVALGTSLKDINGDGIIDTQNSTIAFNTLKTFFDKKDCTLIIA